MPIHTRRGGRGLASRIGLVLAGVTLALLTPVFSQVATPPDEATLRIIVVESAEEARLVKVRLARGEDFADLATALSIDPSAREGGLLGHVALTQLRPELQDAVRQVAADRLSPAVRIPTGFAIVKVETDRGSGARKTPNAALAATGAVKFVTDVSGFAVNLIAGEQFSNPEAWSQAPTAACEQRTRAMGAAHAALTRDYGDATAAPTPSASSEAVHGSFVLGQIHAFRGQMDDAIRHFQRAHALATATDPQLARDLEEVLGIAYLHRGEMANGVYHEPGDRCLLAPAGLPALEKTADFDRAIDHFSRYLAQKPDELEVRWLLNLAHMAAGKYPRRVPAAHLIPPSTFEPGGDIGRFVDVAARSGLRSVASAGGVIVDDFDNDGHLDVVTSSMDVCAPLRFFRGRGDGTFAEAASAAGLGDQLGGLNVSQADYDNDGHLDILVMRGGWELPQRRSLLRNNGNGTFTDVTVASGLAVPATSSQASVWVDVDNDGFLDLFVGNENAAAQLFRNRGNGTFEDVARAAGVARTAFTKGVTAGDYDDDGWPDLYVSNNAGLNFLYRNNRDWTFTEVGRAAGVPGPHVGFATWFFDYDNDGRQDLFVTSYYTSVDETVRTYLKRPNNAASLKLYRNQGDGTFADVSARSGLGKAFMPMGANFGDIDNDGFLDIYLGTGNPSYGALVPSVLLWNRGGQSFVDVTTSSGTGELHKGHGVAFADLDNDGDDEIVFEVGGATPGDAHALRVFENPGHRGDWINLKLAGVKTNRGAVGARITATVAVPGRAPRTIHRTVTSGGSFGASPLQQHIGLGQAGGRVDLDIWWPTSRTRQHFADVPVNQTVAITEFATGLTTLPRPKVRLGGGGRHEQIESR
jgi:tetratricopeptide (TPR) repeat protein